MSTFIVRLELHPSDPEPAYSAVHDALQAAGFSRIYRHQDGVRYHLPASEYCIVSGITAEAVRDLAASAARKVTSLFMLLVSEANTIAIAGLVPVQETSSHLAQPHGLMRPPAANAA